ncbi:hypothetical protein FV218_05680 [Methylobacterium sp. WL69]|uniref:BrnA antitoxin family protein n=1 Tax=Methylobacterium sp. WL69 TaxID=2603893 RepID=UPI0011C9FB11|nr:BrnA antitoxin family protein [Methylobacterium sp. WL69]TXM77329.1 hypothetical protein FV218_05680 [Methylobacterium sp. WL69]
MPLLSEAEETALQHRMAVDPDARELTADELGRMRPAREVLPPALFAALVKRGRPKSETKRVPVTLRVDPSVLDAYKAGGPGWQTRMNAALAQGIEVHGVLVSGTGRRGEG